MNSHTIFFLWRSKKTISTFSLKKKSALSGTMGLLQEGQTVLQHL